MLVTAGALLARWLLDPALGTHLPFVTFFIGVAIVVWYGNLSSALFTVLLGFVLALLFFIPPYYSFFVESVPSAVGLVMYFSVSFVIVGFGHAMRVSQSRAEAAEQHSRAQHELLRRTLLSIGDGVITTDLRGFVTMLNPVAEALTGWSSSEAAGRPLPEVFAIVNETTRLPVENPVERVLAHGGVVGLANHTLLIARDGTESPIADSAAPIEDHDGNLVGAVLVFRDVSEARASGQRIKEVEQRNAAIVASALDAILAIDEEGLVTEFNPAAERMFGRRRGETLGAEMAELIIPAELRDRHREGLVHYLETGEEHVLNQLVELTAQRADGERFPVEVSITRIEQHGRPAFVGYIRDITERKRGEIELLRSEERFRALVMATAAIVWTTNAKGEFDSTQSSWSAYTGQSRDEYMGQGWLDALHPDDRATIQMTWARALATRSNYRVTGRLWHAESGAYRQFEAQGVPIFEGDGSVREWIGQCRDLEKERRLEVQLQKSIGELSEANRRKSEFLAMLAHELRNPLAPIRNMLEIIKISSSDDEVLRGAYAVMDRQLGQMVHLVDDLLDISRISRGKIELRRVPVELSSIVLHAVEAARPDCDAMAQRIDVEMPGAPIRVLADANRLAQVVGNLLNNGSKYSARGETIHLTVALDGGEVVIRVRDNGIGIPSDQLSHIFDLFVQVDPTLERSRSGLGIGLTLVKNIVEMHGGTVSAHSRGAGLGSEFIVRLPILAGEPVETGSADSPETERAARPLRILIVDDNRDAADSLAQLLKLPGNEAYVAYDGEDALRAAEDWRPDVAILDIGLPVMNGYEIASRIRASEWGRGIVLIALTGWGQESDRRRAAEAGFESHFVKPVDSAVLFKALRSIADAR